MIKDTHITYEIIEELPNLSEDNMSFTDGEFSNMKYLGCLIVEKTGDNEIDYYCGDRTDIFNYQELDVLKRWLPEQTYIDNYYRLDFKRYIYLFQVKYLNNKVVMIGNLLKKDFETRLNLAELYQEWIMKKLQYVH